MPLLANLLKIHKISNSDVLDVSKKPNFRVQNQWQTLGEKLSSMFVPSSDVVMEDVVQPADSTLVQAQKIPNGTPGRVDNTPKKGVLTVKSTTPTDEHTCSCGMHLSEAVGSSPPPQQPARQPKKKM